MYSQLELIILVLLLRAMVTGKIHKNGFVIQTKWWRIQKMDSSSNDEFNEWNGSMEINQMKFTKGIVTDIASIH